jgi:hypothetical protein
MSAERHGIPPTTAMDEQEISLEWKFRKDTSLWYKLTQANELSGDWPGIPDGYQVKPEQSEVTFVLRLDVLEIDTKEIATLKISFERVTYKANFMETTYDSETDTDLQQAGIAALKGRSMVARVNSRGEIFSLETKSVRNLLSDQQLSSIVSHCFAILPKGSVAQGEVWESLSPYGDSLVGDTSSRLHLDILRMGMKNDSRIVAIRKDKDQTEAVIATNSQFHSVITQQDYDLEGGPATSKSEIVWLVEQGMLTSLTCTADVYVSWMLIHVKHLRTKTIVRLMSIMSTPTESFANNQGAQRDEVVGLERSAEASPPAGSGTRPRTDVRMGVFYDCANIVTGFRNAFGSHVCETKLLDLIRDRCGANRFPDEAYAFVGPDTLKKLKGLEKRLGSLFNIQTSPEPNVDSLLIRTIESRMSVLSTIVLVSGDGDFAPVLRKAVDEGKRVLVVAVPGQISQALESKNFQVELLDQSVARPR